ncbi:MAG: hypothetical protein KC766_24805 [Myxococcales bacterium]|nr:hypothetical protein [Myxococcales bacterium]
MSRGGALAILLVGCACWGCDALGGGGERAPSPSAITEPAPRALGAHAASQLPLDGGTVGSLREQDPDPLAPEQAPDGEAPAVPPPATPDAGVAL